MKILERASPNFNDRPPGVPVDILVLHYTGMPTAEEALERLCDPVAQVSAHYTVGEDGTVYHHVAEDRRAWHAGVASWAGETDVNGRSIGVEIVNPGHEFGYRPFPEVQMTSVAALCRGIVARHAIPACRVVGHSDVAPDRKRDPGELFDWRGLAGAGVGLWPSNAGLGSGAGLDIAGFQAGLRRYGYGCPDSGTLDDATRTVVASFQRHFRPSAIDGRPDAECAAILSALLKAM
ncbi:MAG: N-acetylmuramoyl-L-alanine amidase [Bauldia litoralis]